MFYDLQKANMLKRFTAYLFDLILLGMCITALATCLSWALGYDSYNEKLDQRYAAIAQEYGIDPEITQEELEALPQAERDRYDAANKALGEDPEALYAYNMVINLTLVILSLSFLGANLVMEFVVPMLFGNGQTLGKKIFSLAVIRTNGVKINNVCLFIRTVLGKCTVETMLPLLLLLLSLFGILGIWSTLAALVILVVQLALVCITGHHGAIHDLLADTVVVDINSQRIFNSDEELLEFYKQRGKEQAQDQPY